MDPNNGPPTLDPNNGQLGIRVEACEQETLHEECKQLVTLSYAVAAVLFDMGMFAGLFCVWLTLLSGVIGSPTALQSQNMASDLLPKCTGNENMNPPVMAYMGYSYGDGMAEMRGGKDNSLAYTLNEVSGFSHVPLRYSYTKGTVYGHFYNIHKGTVGKGMIVIKSLETGGGYTQIQVHTHFDEDLQSSNEYDFRPKCQLDVAQPSYTKPAYAGPYYNFIVSHDNVQAVTCVYRTTTLAYPLHCYKGIADCPATGSCLVDSILTEGDFSLSAMSLPSKSSSYPSYGADTPGTYSVLGVGRWNKVDPKPDSGNGTFVGTMYVNDTESGEPIVVVEGYVSIPANSDSSLSGDFSLRTWELGFKSSESLNKTASAPPKQKSLREWACNVVDPDEYEYFFPFQGKLICLGESTPDVHWLGLWSQYNSSVSKENPNLPCLNVANSDGNGNNTLQMFTNGQDTQINATVKKIESGEIRIQFEQYGDECTDNVCNCPGMLKGGCERAANHGPNTPWVDIGVGGKDVWLSDKMGLIGAEPFDAGKEYENNTYRFQAGKQGNNSSMTFRRMFNTHSRALDVVQEVKGSYPTGDENIRFKYFGRTDPGGLAEYIPYGVPEAGVFFAIDDSPHPISCYLSAETNCVLSAKPYCYVRGGNDTPINPIEVSFQADALVEMGGLDNMVTWATLRGQIQGKLTMGDGTMLGTPIDITGLLIPFTDSSVESVGTDTTTPTGPCHTVQEAAIVITNVALPIYTQMIYDMYHSVDLPYIDDIELTYTFLSVAGLRVWSIYQFPTKTALQGWTKVKDKIDQVVTTCTCLWSH